MVEFDFSTFPTLTTPRLILREIIPADAADLFSFHSDPEVQKYDSDPPMREIAEAISRIAQIGQWFASGQAIIWGIAFKGENRLIGGLGFYFWGKVYYKTELGYTVARPYWRRGIRRHLHPISVISSLPRLTALCADVDSHPSSR